MSSGRGAAGFDRHFAEIYGERWPRLKEALLSERRQVQRPNAFAREGLQSVYVMDPASIEAARALEVQAGQRVLDLCAAPGGKSLVLAEALLATDDPNGELICNEISADRRERLIKVIQNYVPRDVRDHVFVRGVDGARFGLREPESFDRILVDAPCSGERHLLENPTELEQWSPRRSENLAVRQYALLAGAWLALKPGGRMVYSTCSISPLENDGVVDRLVKKKKANVIRREWILPDENPGEGPLYFAVIEK